MQVSECESGQILAKYIKKHADWQRARIIPNMEGEATAEEQLTSNLHHPAQLHI